MDPELAAVAADRGGAFTRRDALRAGYSAGEIRHRLASGRWVALRRGTYCEAVAGSLRARVSALLAGLPTGATASHTTAAQLLGLPLLSRDPWLHVTVPRSRARRRGGVRVHASALAERDVLVIDGVPVTSRARTAVDIARSAPTRAGVVVADAVLAAGATRTELLAALGRLGDVNGRPRVVRVVAASDGRSESPGESLSRLAISAAGLPAPVLQHEVFGDGGLVARVDFWWPSWRLVGEFDGRVKYGQSADLWAEKQREDRLRALGLAVVRWVWADVVGDFTPVVRRILAASRRAAA